MKLDAYLGVDAGTTAIKVLVVDTSGEVIGEGDARGIDLLFLCGDKRGFGGYLKSGCEA